MWFVRRFSSGRTPRNSGDATRSDSEPSSTLPNLLGQTLAGKVERSEISGDASFALTDAGPLSPEAVTLTLLNALQGFMGGCVVADPAERRSTVEKLVKSLENLSALLPQPHISESTDTGVFQSSRPGSDGAPALDAAAVMSGPFQGLPPWCEAFIGTVLEVAPSPEVCQVTALLCKNLVNGLDRGALAAPEDVERIHGLWQNLKPILGQDIRAPRELQGSFHRLDASCAQLGAPQGARVAEHYEVVTREARSQLAARIMRACAPEAFIGSEKQPLPEDVWFSIAIALAGPADAGLAQPRSAGSFTPSMVQRCPDDAHVATDHFPPAFSPPPAPRPSLFKSPWQRTCTPRPAQIRLPEEEDSCPPIGDRSGFGRMRRLSRLPGLRAVKGRRARSQEKVLPELTYRRSSKDSIHSGNSILSFLSGFSSPARRPSQQSDSIPPSTLGHERQSVQPNHARFERRRSQQSESEKSPVIYTGYMPAPGTPARRPSVNSTSSFGVLSGIGSECRNASEWDSLSPASSQVGQRILGIP